MNRSFLVLDCILFLCVLLLLSVICFADVKRPPVPTLPKLPNKVMKNKIRVPGKLFLFDERRRLQRKRTPKRRDFNRLILL